MNLAWRDIRHKLGRFVLTCLGLSLLLARRDHDGRHLPRPDRGRAGPRARPSRRTSGSSRPARTAPSPKPRASPATRARWWRASMAWSKPARSRSRTFRSSAAAAGCGCRSSATSRAVRAGPSGSSPGREITRSHYELIADRQTGLTVGETVHLGALRLHRRRRDIGRRHAVGRLDRLHVAAGMPSSCSSSWRRLRRGARRRAARSARRPISSMPWSRGSRPMCRSDEVAEVIRRWKHLSVLTDDEQEAAADPQPSSSGRGASSACSWAFSPSSRPSSSRSSSTR